MANVYKEFTLPKGRNFLRITNTDATDDMVIANILPHADVYDGFEMTVLLEIPSTADRKVILKSRFTSPSNLNLDGTYGFDGQQQIEVQNGSVTATGYRAIAKFIWDSINSYWSEISRVRLSS